MKKLVVILSLASLASISAQAAEQKIYYLHSGKTIDVSEALVRSLRGDEIFKCQNVEAKPNKKGTSISLRSVKKAKTE